MKRFSLLCVCVWENEMSKRERLIKLKIVELRVLGLALVLIFSNKYRYRYSRILGGRRDA